MGMREADRQIATVAANDAGRHSGRGRTWIQLSLRLDEELKAELHQAAEEHGQSLNTEIVKRLKSSFGLEETRRRLQVERDELRRETAEARGREAEMQKRLNQMIDHLLQSEG